MHFIDTGLAKAVMDWVNFVVCGLLLECPETYS